MAHTPSLVLVVSGHSVDWLAVGFVAVLAIIGVALFQFSVTGRRNKKTAPVGYTGRVLERPSVTLPEPGDASCQWHAEGRGWVVGQRSSARSVLEVRDGALTLSLRPWIIQSVLGAHLYAEADDDDFVAFPVRWHGRTCVGLRRPDVTAYFATSEPETVLGVIATAGFRVTWAEERARRI